MVAGELNTEELLGHDEMLNAVRKLAREESLAQALLIVGADGIGKTTFALTLAAGLTCLSPGADGRRCGVCRSCVLAQAGTHPDILRVSPPKEETTIGQVRDLRYTANLAPSLSPRRVIIIERAETLNDQASNAILKVLEDSPERLTLVLLAPSAKSVLPTIRSRSLQIPLRPSRLEDLEAFLEARGAPAARAHVLASYAAGAPGRAISLLDSDDLAAALDGVGQWLKRLAQADPGSALRLAEDLRAVADAVKKSLKGEDGGTDRQAIAWVLDALMAALQSALYAGSSGSGNAPSAGAALLASRWGLERIAAMIDAVNQTRRLILSYAQADLQVDRMVIRFLLPPPREHPG